MVNFDNVTSAISNLSQKAEKLYGKFVRSKQEGKLV